MLRCFCFFAALVLAACNVSAEPEPPQAVLEIRGGQVEVMQSANDFFTAGENGQELGLLDRVRTGGDGLAAIVFFEGSVVLLEPNSDVTIEQLIGSRETGRSNLQVFQAAGRTLHRVSKLVDAESSYAVRTGSSIGLVRGSTFIVDDTDGGTKWKSIEGTIGLAGESGQETLVINGNSSDVPLGGDPSPPVIDPPTPEEIVQLDVLQVVAQEVAPPPPPQKDPEISTPVSGPTPTLPPKDEPPPTPAPQAAVQPTPTDTPTEAPAPAPAVSGPAPTDTPAAAPVAEGGGQPPPTNTPTPTSTPASAEPPPAPTATPSPPAPTPTLPPTTSPTPLPTITPTPSPTPTLTPTFTPTPTPTLLPTFTPSPTPTPTPIPAGPVPSINSPRGGATVAAGTVLNISGSGTAAPGLAIDGYSWGFNGSQVSGQASFTLIVNSSGTLTLQVRDSSGVWSDETASVGINVIAPTPTPTPTREPTATPEPEATATPTPNPTATTAAGTATPTPIAADIWVRTDGHDEDCNGTANTAYPGSGTGLACALKTFQTGIARASAGNTIAFAAGTYPVTSNLTISKANLHLIGDPGTSQIGPGSSAPVLDLTGPTSRRIDLSADSIIFEGFEVNRGATFNNSTGAISGDGFRPAIRIANGASGVIVRFNLVRGANRGIAVGDCTNTCGSNATITDNILKWNTSGIFIAGTDNSVIRNNDIFENEQGIEFYDTWGAPTGNLIDRNHIHENGRNGIYIEGTNNTVQYNLMERNGLYSGASSTGGISIAGPGNGNKIDYNTIQNNGWHGIELNSATHATLTISINLVTGNGSLFGAGNPSAVLLLASGSMGVTMTANKITSNTGAGIYIQSSATGGSATGNVITSNTTKALIHASTGTFTATGNDWGVYTNDGGEIDALITISGGGAVTITGFVTSALSLSPGAGDTSSYPTTLTPTPTNTSLPTATATPS